MSMETIMEKFIAASDGHKKSQEEIMSAADKMIEQISVRQNVNWMAVEIEKSLADSNPVMAFALYMRLEEVYKNCFQSTQETKVGLINLN